MNYIRIFTLLSLLLLLGLASCNNSKVNLEILELETLSGRNVSLDRYKGNMVFLNFWATWCGPCVKEWPGLEAARKELKNDYEFVMVSDESSSKIRNFKNKNNSGKFDYLHLTQNIKEVGIFSIPQAYVLDRKGNVIASFSGGHDWSEIKNIEKLKNLIDAKPN